jgi:hypothetical protein
VLRRGRVCEGWLAQHIDLDRLTTPWGRGGGGAGGGAPGGRGDILVRWVGVEGAEGVLVAARMVHNVLPASRNITSYWLGSYHCLFLPCCCCCP